MNTRAERDAIIARGQAAAERILNGAGTRKPIEYAYDHAQVAGTRTECHKCGGTSGFYLADIVMQELHYKWDGGDTAEGPPEAFGLKKRVARCLDCDVRLTVPLSGKGEE